MRKNKSKLTCHQHERIAALNKIPAHGRFVNRLKTVLRVPELRKPRSQRDPILLEQQQDAAPVVD